MRSVLLAGATGLLGRQVARELVARGYVVRRLVRDLAGPGDWLGDLRWPPSLREATRGVDAVISCAGASMRLNDWSDRTTFDEIDWVGNRNLLEAAERTGTQKFVYVSLAGGSQLVATKYARAHERFVTALAGSGLPATVLRPTGLFAFFGNLLEMAARGIGIVVGDGAAQTNPIDEADAGRAVVDALTLPRQEMTVGGPVVYTRRDIVSEAFRAVGRSSTIRSVPSRAVKGAAAVLGLMNPRIAALVEFGAAVSQVDVVAPKYGTRLLEEYFADMAKLRKYSECHSPLKAWSFSENSRRTTTASGSSHARSGTKSSSAAR